MEIRTQIPTLLQKTLLPSRPSPQSLLATFSRGGMWHGRSREMKCYKVTELESADIPPCWLDLGFSWDLGSSVLKPSALPFLFSFHCSSFNFLSFYFIHFTVGSPFSSFHHPLHIDTWPHSSCHSFHSLFASAMCCILFFSSNMSAGIYCIVTSEYLETRAFVNIHSPYAPKTLSFWFHRWSLSVCRPNNNLWKKKACIFPGYRICHIYQTDSVYCVSCFYCVFI